MRLRLPCVISLLLLSAPCWATTYYLSPNGSDGNSGTRAGHPWLSPNHDLNCGDVIVAAASTHYSAANFYTGKWGTVTCPAANNVAWVKCATFDACKINESSGSNPAVWIDHSFWGIQGFEVTVASNVTYGSCFQAGSVTTSNVVHHIIFANNIANGCAHGGFITFNEGTTGGADYVSIIGNIAYNASRGSSACASGISIYQPIASDTNAGTHIFIAGNFTYGNVDGNPCAGGPPTDGEAVILDTFDFSQGGGTPYTQQAVVENNIGFFNGGRGFEAFNNQVGSAQAPIYFKYNTSFGNNTDNNQTNGCLGRSELYTGYALNVNRSYELAQTKSGTSCSNAPVFGFTAETTNATSTLSNSWIYSAAGYNTLIDNSPEFVLGSGNTLGSTPSFSNPVNPGAPSCGSFASVPACMATVISDYTPTVTAARAYGYQTPSTTSVSDPLYPHWLCNVTLPSGLVTPGCS